jgi:mRNA interferase YafQ
MLKYTVDYTSTFKKQYKKIKKQGKDLNKLSKIIERISNNEKLETKYNNHNLINNKIYKNCKECHIEPDWLLIYKIESDNLILLLVTTGSHSDLFNN